MTTTDQLWTPAEIRNGDLASLRAALEDQSSRRRDLVIPAKGVKLDDQGLLQVPSVTHDLTPEGVTEIETTEGLQLLDIAHGHLSERTGIPRAYYRRLQDGHLDLLAANVNRWLENDTRSVTLRTFTREGGPDLLRAVLSDRYGFIDSWDVVLSSLQGIREAGVVDPSQLQITGDLTERRLRVRVTAPEVGTNVADLLGDYRSPFNGRSGQDLPQLWAGLEISNSETGGGAFVITPRVVLQVCSNGMTISKDVARAVHLGAKLDEGAVNWSQQTQRKTLELITSRAKDAVTTFLSKDYVESVANDLRELQGVEVRNVAKVIESVGKELSLNEDEADELLNLFTVSADTTALGIGHAITALAQKVENPERAAELEGSFFKSVEVAAAV